MNRPPRSLPFALALTAALSSCGLFRSARPPEYPPYTTDTGLIIEDLVLPTAARASIGDEVTVHYVARLEGGEAFDSSYELGRPVTFVIGEGHVPRGLEEGILGMAEGGRRRLVLPPELAYGEEGVPSRVPGGATVVFEIELLDIAE